MAQADHLPIFKASYDLCLHLEQVVEPLSLPSTGSGTRSTPARAGHSAWRGSIYPPR